MCLDVFLPEVRKVLWNFLWGDLLEFEDEDAGEDDAEDVDDGEEKTDQAQQESLDGRVAAVLRVVTVAAALAAAVAQTLQQRRSENQVRTSLWETSS